MRFKLRWRKGREGRCAYCHEETSEAPVPCLNCGVRLHPDCWQEIGACPTLGCLGSRKPARAEDRISLAELEAEQTQRKARRPIPVAVPILGALAFFSFSLVLCSPCLYTPLGPMLPLDPTEFLALSLGVGTLSLLLLFLALKLGRRRG